MQSSSNMSGETYEITEITRDWVDNGNIMFGVRVTRLSDGTKWFMRHWARDELDAYTLAMRKLERAS